MILCVLIECGLCDLLPPAMKHWVGLALSLPLTNILQRVLINPRVVPINPCIVSLVLQTIAVQKDQKDVYLTKGW
jgi:hypothetical protein